jgi:DNA-binding FadR family transcriptional regulator
MEGSSIPARRPRARTEAAANEIRHHILSGTWANGRLLPSEREMAAQFGVARNTLRRIVRQLEAEGLIESHPGRGTFVRIAPLGELSSRAEALPSGLHDTAAPDFVKRLQNASPQDLMEVRALLEPLAAELAANRATAEDIAAIESALQNSINANSLAAFEHWDAALHLAMLRAAGNDVLLAWGEAINLTRHVAPELRGSYIRDHADILVALRDRDPDLARELVRRHMTRTRQAPLPVG